MLAPGRSLVRRHLGTIALGSSACVLFLKYQSDRAHRRAKEYQIAPIQQVISENHLHVDGRPPCGSDVFPYKTSITEFDRLRTYYELLLQPVIDKLQLTNGYVIGTIASALVAHRCYTIFQQIMTVRCGDVAYNLRQPDLLHMRRRVLSQGIYANGLLPIGLLCCAGGVAFGIREAIVSPVDLEEVGEVPETASALSTGARRESGNKIRGTTPHAASPSTFLEQLRTDVFGYPLLVLRDGLSPVLRSLSSSNLAEFSNFVNSATR
ncbi:unnamed protein product [Amoebophrya sp. A120]|nr:unnamed protein product [Amoebophrya sp. A120]|eukprot:GSA120T00012082001.1